VVKAPALLAAPHRLLFLTGAFQFAAMLAWWSGWLLELSGIGLALPQPIPGNLLHAPILLFLMLPSFFFGFLLTVFPRWTGFPDSGLGVYLPVAAGFALAAIALWIGLGTGLAGFIEAAFALAATGWIWALGCMVRPIVLEHRAGRPPTWHAWSILLGLIIGLHCLGLAAAGLLRLDPLAVHIANLVMLDLCVIPVFVTVCHRMIPFFAGNVVKGYEPWRPYWLLGVFWAASFAGTLAFAYPLIAGAGKFALAILTGLMVWKWWPRAAAPGLLWVLVLGFSWAPMGFAVAGWTAILAPELGRAAIHMLTVGFAGSLVIAMVTRVTQGHSGRPLEMPIAAWPAFVAVQAATLLRVLAAARGEHLALLTLSALAMAIGIFPWAARAIWIYLRPRLDGKPG